MSHSSKLKSSMTRGLGFHQEKKRKKWKKNICNSIENNNNNELVSNKNIHIVIIVFNFSVALYKCAHRTVIKSHCATITDAIYLFIYLFIYMPCCLLQKPINSVCVSVCVVVSLNLEIQSHAPQCNACEKTCTCTLSESTPRRYKKHLFILLNKFHLIVYVRFY